MSRSIRANSTSIDPATGQRDALHPLLPHQFVLPHYLAYIILVSLVAGGLLLWGTGAVRAQDLPPQADLPLPAMPQIDSAIFATKPVWFSPRAYDTRKIVWGDVDGDGDLDIALANAGPRTNPESQPSMIFLNQGGLLSSSLDNAIVLQVGEARDAAWADVDRDGDLDLAVVFVDGPNMLYINSGVDAEGKPIMTPVSLGDSDRSLSLAWGDLNGDGFFDLAVGNYCTPNKIYMNNAGTLQTSTPTLLDGNHATVSLDWADMDNDGDLDLAVGDSNLANLFDTNGAEDCSDTPEQGFAKVFRNVGGSLEATPFWQASVSSPISELDWGDLNGDMLPDLAVASSESGGDGDASVVYTNTYGQTPGDLFSAPPVELGIWLAKTVQWGDVDGDGDQDLFLGIFGDSSMIFVNQANQLTIPTSWLLAEASQISSSAWGDVDNDGDLDIAVGNQNTASSIQENIGSGMVEMATVSDQAMVSLAWGDMDNDGDLDLATITDCFTPTVGSSQVFPNVGAAVDNTPIWQSGDVYCGDDLAWGDMNGDGWLDLAVATRTEDRVYLNINGMLQNQSAWASAEKEASLVLAWGDVDGDGDLDLVAGGIPSGDQGSSNIRLYKNANGMLTTTAAWSVNISDVARDLAWGDIDGDGDLDLAVVGDAEPAMVYYNEQGTLSAESSRVWKSEINDVAHGVAWGDADGDGDLDLAVASNGFQNYIHYNNGGRLDPQPGWLSWDSKTASKVAWADADSDGDLDLSVAHGVLQSDRIYYTHNGTLRTNNLDVWDSEELLSSLNLAWADVDGDGLLELAISYDVLLGFSPIRIYRSQTATSARPRLALSLGSDGVTSFSGQQANTLAPADGYAVAGIRQSGTIPITYYLHDEESSTFAQVRAFYSLDGGGKWYPAIPTGDTQTTNLASRPFPTRTGANTHLFKWDVAASGFFGQSDNVVVRIEAIPSVRPVANAIPRPQLYGKIGSQTYPFRVRGTQVRVYSETVTPANVVSGAILYQLPSTQTGVASPIGRGNTVFTTDSTGFLQGRGALGLGDRLVALSPMTTTAKYTVYRTSAAPTLAGVTPYTVTATGVQNLVVSDQTPLMLFNLTVSLEWDARRDTSYLTQLSSDLARASEALYDATNGQAALGAVTVYHDRQKWETADLRIHATIGGSVTQVTQTALPNGDQPPVQLAFFPGTIEMPATWNRFGEASGALGEDWPRALAHEFGHYFFFLLEDYLGFDDAGLPIPISTCPSLMGNVYLDENSEFHPRTSWTTPAYLCLSTLQHQTMQRSDWETITAFYPWLHGPTVGYANQLAGPTTLPLAVTQIATVDPVDPATTLAVPSYYLVKPDNARYLPTGYARGFRFHDGNLTDLGQPRRDHLQAWGTRAGGTDRVCVFDMNPDGPAVGCVTAESGITRLTVQPTPNWRPDIIVAPVTTNTLALTVTNVAAGADLRAQIYATDRPVTTTAPAQIVLSYNASAGAYHATLPVHLAAFLRLWDANTPAHELVTDFTLGGAPTLNLGNGFSLQLGNGTVLQLGNGTTQVLEDGAVLQLGNGTALQLGNGTAQLLGDGSVLQLGNGTTLQLGNGTALQLGNGTALQLGNGTALQLGNGTSLIVANGNALQLGNGTALQLGNGTALQLGDGFAQVLEDGNGPVLSSDGQVVLFVDTLDFAPGQYYTLQPATRVPNPPVYATVVGQPYRLAASPGAPAIVGSALSFRYMGRDVPPGEENFLKVWFYSQATGTWSPLATTLDTVQNSAAAAAQGPGLYVLMSSIEIPLRRAGWNLVSYPIQGSRAVTQALSYLAERQSDWWILGYDELDAADPWRIYAPGPSPLPQLSTLSQLNFGRGYWIHVSQPITLYLRGAENQTRLSEAPVPLSPPTTFWGPIFPSENFTPKAGMLVEARIDGRLCGSTRTRTINGATWYLLNVSADDGEAFAGCGAPDRMIQLVVGSQAVIPAQPWKDASLYTLDLSLAKVQSLFLPQVFVDASMALPVSAP